MPITSHVSLMNNGIISASDRHHLIFKYRENYGLSDPLIQTDFSRISSLRWNKLVFLVARKSFPQKKEKSCYCWLLVSYSLTIFWVFLNKYLLWHHGAIKQIAPWWQWIFGERINWLLLLLRVVLTPIERSITSFWQTAKQFQKINCLYDGDFDPGSIVGLTPPILL